MDEPWYREGLRFACTQCGRCCTGEPGNVWISEEEIVTLAARLGIDEAAFRRRYTVERRKGISLTEKSNNDCVFYQRDHGCTVYEDRPRQCRTWPFWRCNLGEPEDWRLAGEECPGVDRGPVHDAEAIRRIAADDGLP
mgnify:CR=1 FL=1